ncbi:FAD-binding protein [Kordia sp. YSTF-M3]|uniref:FAD-binding protein n=1 Tax=Kordia aestuariivivens TaxID=2759037 RepID=A0ABR7Q923_9FLAO|nr:FAD-dependent oxidoreductase [Kordia aestuariivivens]MBC8755051.1 FAD-binding protein [Kordia aestuariivivens]
MNASIKKNARKGLKIISKGDELYHYARVISNTRFGYMPAAVVYCDTTEDVSFCINYCRDHKVPFRVRSGGHQHEGMCSANNAIIIDLSEINKITDIDKKKNTAWIPAGKQLGQVYEELEKIHKTIPGGGCQSVNVGGLTQGGGWGTSIRKYGLTCDSVTDIELVLASGEKVIANNENKYADLFKALKGGGGGNFGVVIRFKFKLVSILPVVTTFGLQWEKPKDVKGVVTRWAELHAKKDGIVEELSATCTMIIEKLPNSKEFGVHGRMGGKFYGSRTKLKVLLHDYFGEFLPKELKNDIFSENPVGYSDTSKLKKAALKSKTKSKDATPTLSYTANQRLLTDFINPAGNMEYSMHIGKKCKDLSLTILPSSGPSSTCDQPHPHKVSSSFPKDDVDHKKLVEQVYTYLKNSCYRSDVNMYMSFHCMGGAVTNNAGKNSFGYAQKPYMLQIQAWWDDVSNVFTNVGRNSEYLKWVKDFRISLNKYTEGSFINFVDKTLVPDIEKEENRLKLLEIYYNKKNLNELRKVKKKYDPAQLFSFQMSILPK